MADTIGERIELALAKNNMTRKELVEKSGIGKSSMSDYIRNKNIPSLSKILIISEALGVTPQWLSGFEKKDSCNFYKIEETYALYEIYPCEFCARGSGDKIVLIKQEESIEYCKYEDSLKPNEKIKKMLNMLGLMVKELAERIGKTPNQVTDYVHGRRNPSLSTIEAFADALQVSPSWLAGFIDIDTRNTFAMTDNPEKTMYLHPSQYIIKEIKDNGDTIILEKVEKTKNKC